VDVEIDDIKTNFADAGHFEIRIESLFTAVNKLIQEQESKQNHDDMGM